MSKRISVKTVNENLNEYSRVSTVKDKGRQYILPFNWQHDKHCFQFLFFAYGKKTRVSKIIAEVLNTKTDEEIAGLDWVKCDSKVPIGVEGYKGLNCF